MQLNTWQITWWDGTYNLSITEATDYSVMLCVGTSQGITVIAIHINTPKIFQPFWNPKFFSNFLSYFPNFFFFDWHNYKVLQTVFDPMTLYR
jgi:hypothetical protein